MQLDPNQARSDILSGLNVSPNCYIYILSVVALDETNISGCLHFSMQNIEISCDLDGTSWRINVNVSVLCLSTFA